MHNIYHCMHTRSCLQNTGAQQLLQECVDALCNSWAYIHCTTVHSNCMQYSLLNALVRVCITSTSVSMPKSVLAICMTVIGITVVTFLVKASPELPNLYSCRHVIIVTYSLWTHSITINALQYNVTHSHIQPGIIMAHGTTLAAAACSVSIQFIIWQYKQIPHMYQYHTRGLELTIITTI